MNITTKCSFLSVWLILPLLECAYISADIGTKCSTSEGHGVCQLINQCEPVYNNLLSGKRPEVVCGYQDFTPIVCCPIRNSSALEIPTNQLTNARPSRRMCAEYKQLLYNKNSDELNDDSICTNSKRAHFVIGGSEAKEMEFPYMAAVGYITSDSTISWECGGTLISDTFVLTAAHCTISPQWGDAQWVRLGDLRLKATIQPQVIRIIKRIRHPKYQRPVQYNDIALLKLQTLVTFNIYVRPACLDVTGTHSAGELAVATGWGIVDWSNEIGSESLLKVTLPIVDHSDCESFYTDDTNRLPNGIDDRSQMCAGEDDKDTCQGDSGGPLVIPTEESINTCLYDVIGVTSFGQLCGSISPGVYSRVSFYLPWIESIVWPNFSVKGDFQSA